MSLAPASSRGAFLKARLAVNGIQCAARSFGTLRAGEAGLLSSMGASRWDWRRLLGAKLPASRRHENFNNQRALALSPRICMAAEFLCQIGRGDPEHLAFGFLSVEPEQRKMGTSILERRAPAPDLAQ